MISDLSIDFQMVKNGGLKKLLSMSILKVWQLTLILAKQDPMGRGYTEKEAFLHSSDEKTWFLTFPLIFKWSKMGGLKKLLSMSIMKVWQLTLILTKQDSLGRGHIEKWAFLHSSDEKTWFLTFPLVFKWSNMGFKKASLYVYFEGLTTDSYFGKTRPCGGRSYRKKAFYHSSDEKTWFLTFPLIFKWSPMGVFKKASLYVYFEGLTTDSYFGKARLPGERLYRKNGFFTLFWWENMISDLSIDFQMVTNGGGLKKLLSMSIMKVWQLTLIQAKQDPLGRGHIEKMAFLHSSDEKTWFLTFPLIFKWSKMGGFKKASLYVYFEGLTTNSYSAKQDSLGRGHIEKMGLFTLFWSESMISDLSIDFQMVKNGGLKKLLSMSIMKVWQLTLILTKQDSLGRGHIEKWAFLHSSDEKTWFLTFPLIFKWTPMGGLKKLLSMSILKVWQLTLILAKQDPMGRGYTEKKAFLHSSDEKAWFLTFPLIFKWSKMRGFKKASLYVHYEGLTTDSYFDKTRLPGKRSYRKMGFLHSSDEKTWFQTFPLVFKWSKMGGFKKLFSMSILKVWQLTLILAKQDPVEGGHIEKRLFYTLLMRKHDFWLLPLIFKWSKMEGS